MEKQDGMEKRDINDPLNVIKIPEETMAFHLYAVILAHHYGESSNQKKTYRELIAADEYLKYMEKGIFLEYICAFGKYGLPILEKFLMAVYGHSVSEIKAKVKPITEDLLDRVFVD